MPVKEVHDIDRPNGPFLAGSIFRSVEANAEMRQLLEIWHSESAGAAKIQVVAYVAAHCLFMREVVKHYPRFDSADFFNAMSDETKRCLASSAIRRTSPMEMFPDGEQRRVIVGAFFGPDVVNSQERIITPDRLFGMVLSSQVGYFFTKFDSLHVGKLSLLSAPRASEGVMVFMLHSTFGWVGAKEVPIELRDRCLNLGARMVGIVKDAIESSPIR
jgi:hypothetical protein